MSLRRPRIKIQPNVARRVGLSSGQGPTTDNPEVNNKKEEKDKQATENTSVVNDSNADCVKSKDASEKSDSAQKPPGPPATGRRGRIKPQVRLPAAKSATSKSTDVQSAKEQSSQPEKETPGTVRSADEPTSAIAKPVPETSDNPKDGATPENSAHGRVNEISLTVVTSCEDGGKGVDVPDKVPVTKDKSALSPPARPLVKRGLLPKARPIISAYADRQRTRVSSVCENEDGLTIQKEKQNQPQNCTVTNSASEDDISKETGGDGTEKGKSRNDEKPPKPKVKRNKRRKPLKLDDDTLVSENRNKFTISDLIHLNPGNTSNSKRRKKDVDKESETDLTRPSTPDLPQTESTIQPDEPEVEEDMEVEEVAQDDEQNNTSMAPQVMIGPDGNIILNETSLVIDNPATKADKTIVEGDIVVENDNYDPGFYYKKKSRCHVWSLKETCKFYVALSTVGTDFSLMTALFPKRSRVDLKRKFKVEERKHKALIDRALTERRELDMSLFESSSDEDAGNENSPTGDIKQAVRQELQKESQAKKDGRKNRKKKEKQPTKKAEEKSAPKPAKKPAKAKAKRKKAKKSRYYENSESEEEAELPESVAEMQEEAEDDEEEIEIATFEVPETSDEECILEKVVSKKTRAGRQPKVTKQYQAEPPSQKRPRKKSTEALTQMMPLVNLSSGGTTKGVIEDSVTGQRLLLVKSPPPAGLNSPSTDVPSEFVHVYLLSPSVPRQQEEGTGHRPRSATNPEDMQKMKIIGERVTMIKDSAKPGTSTDQNDRIIGPIQNVLFSPNTKSKPTGHPAELGNNTSTENVGTDQSADPCESGSKIQSPPQPTRLDSASVQTPSNEPTETSEVTQSSPSVENSERTKGNEQNQDTSDSDTSKTKDSESKGQDTTESKPVVKTFDNSSITTITTTDGDVVEILIEPNLTGGFTAEDVSDDDGYSIVNIEMPIEVDNVKPEK